MQRLVVDCLCWKRRAVIHLFHAVLKHADVTRGGTKLCNSCSLLSTRRALRPGYPSMFHRGNLWRTLSSACGLRDSTMALDAALWRGKLLFPGRGAPSKAEMDVAEASKCVYCRSKDAHMRVSIPTLPYIAPIHVIGTRQ